jgi:hypothetical protein
VYTIRPCGMPQYLKLFEELALPLALKYLGEPLWLLRHPDRAVWDT